MVLYFTQRWILGPVIPSLMQDFSANRTSLGIIGSASLWGYMFTPIIAGLLSDRFGRKYPMLFGILGFSIFTVVSGLATGMEQLFMGRFLTGIGEAFYFISLMAFTLELFPDRPGFYLTFMTSGNSLGWFAGPALAGWLLDLTGSWRWPFIATGLAGVGLTALLYWFCPKEERKPRPNVFFDRAALKPGNLLMLLLLALTCAFEIATEFGFTMWYPVFLRTELQMSATIAGLLAGIFGIGQFFGRPIMGLISDKVGYRNVGAAGSLLQGISLMLILSVASPYLKALFTFQAGFVGAAVIGALLTFTGLVFPSFKGLALGLIVTFAYSTASLAPVGIGYISDQYRVSTGLWSICVPAAFAACLPFLATHLLKRAEKTVKQKDNQVLPQGTSPGM
jgi:MFS transporter, DHA1 family, solute carrier family 18 (vesicular amine transporter), member 1/2